MSSFWKLGLPAYCAAENKTRVATKIVLATSRIDNSDIFAGFW